MIFHLILQLLLITISCAGIGLLLHHFVFRNSEWRWSDVSICFAGGYVVQILLLENLVFLNLPVQWTFWLPFTLAGFGLYRYRGRFLEKWHSDRSFRRQTFVLLGIFSVAFWGQSVSAIIEGSGNYYGMAHIDHVNYTLIAEFLKTTRFHTAPEVTQTTPWLLKPIQYRDLRIGQSVAQALVACLGFASTKDAYAGTIGVSYGLLGMGAYTLARAVALNRIYAIVASLWTVVSPAMTQMQLDGFLSQAATLFVFPFLLVSPRSRGSLSPQLVWPTLFLSFLLVTYTEFYLVGVGVFILVTLAISGLSLASLRNMAIVLSLSIVLVPAYVSRAIPFVIGQYKTATNVNSMLDVLTPNAATLLGWAQLFVDVSFISGPLQTRCLLIIGIFIVTLAAAGLFTSSLRTRLLLGACTAAAWTFLGVILTAPVFAKYPFGKILNTFTFLWITLTLLGIVHTGLLLRRGLGQRGWTLGLAGALALFSLGVFGFAVQHREVVNHGGTLAMLNTPSLKQAIAYGESHPERTFLIRDNDGLVSAWLAYHTSKSKTYMDSLAMSDLPLSPGLFEFSKVPVGAKLTTISSAGVRDENTRLPIPEVAVSNPQGKDGQGSSYWYWLGDSMIIEIGRYDGSSSPSSFPLTFTVEPGPANPSTLRVLSLTDLQTDSITPIRVSGTQKVAVQVVLSNGINKFRLESQEPLEHVIKIPGDNRKHLSRIFDLAVGAAGSAQPLIDAGVRPPPGTPPVLTVINSQGKDSAGANVWYWVGKGMDFKIESGDAQEKLYRLSFRAEAGLANPNPKRTIRVLDQQKKTSKSYTFIGTMMVDAVVAVPAGTSVFSIEVIEPLEHVVKIPGDGRFHLLRVQDVSLIASRAGIAAPVR